MELQSQQPPRTVWAFGWGLAILLAGYMFLGRGFAHIGLGPIYLGELVLGLAILALVVVRPRVRLHWLQIALLLFMAWGAVRTVPYLPTDGLNALREGTLWGYGIFAIAVSLLATSTSFAFVRGTYRTLAIAFAFWAPVAWWIFGTYSDYIPSAPGSEVPLLYVKNTDFAVHLVGVVAFIVAGGLMIRQNRWFIFELALSIPLSFGLYFTLSLSRGAIASAIAAIVALFVVRPRSTHWVPVVLSGLCVMILVTTDPLAPVGVAQPTPSAPTTTAKPEATPTPSAETSLPPGPAGPPRDVSTDQLFDNIVSIFGESGDEGLEGTKRFRLTWWRDIIDYTFNGPYFWVGKGFGVNLADADGFQVAEGVMRAPHNSHLSILARMGVPGFALWLILQAGFGVSLLCAAIRARRLRLGLLAVISAWTLVYWTAMMIDTSFDPYLEGPQGGIWFWTLFGLGLVCIREVRLAATRA